MSVYNEYNCSIGKNSNTQAKFATADCNLKVPPCIQRGDTVKLVQKTFRLTFSANLFKEVLVYHNMFNKINIFCFTKLENL